MLAESASPETQHRVAVARVARLATAGPVGTPHVVPFCFAVLDGAIVSAVDQKPKTTIALRRLANIAANPSVSMVIDHYADDWSELWWIRIDGTASITESGTDYDRSLDALAAKYPQYVTDRPRGPVITISPTTIKTWGAVG